MRTNDHAADLRMAEEITEDIFGAVGRAGLRAAGIFSSKARGRSEAADTLKHMSDTLRQQSGRFGGKRLNGYQARWIIYKVYGRVVGKEFDRLMSEETREDNFNELILTPAQYKKVMPELASFAVAHGEVVVQAPNQQKTGDRRDDDRDSRDYDRQQQAPSQPSKASQIDINKLRASLKDAKADDATLRKIEDMVTAARYDWKEFLALVDRAQNSIPAPVASALIRAATGISR